MEYTPHVTIEEMANSTPEKAAKSLYKQLTDPERRELVIKQVGQEAYDGVIARLRRELGMEPEKLVASSS